MMTSYSRTPSRALSACIFKFGAGLAILVAGTAASKADAIDGDWCFAALTLNIQGPRIRTPGGTDAQGDYTRHSFRYVTPANEAGAGTLISIQLLNEENMQLTRAATPTAAQPEVWKRCRPTS